MKKIKIGVFGAYRGTSMINYCDYSNNAEVVAICDKWQEAIDNQKGKFKDKNITYYNNFDDFIKHDMDAVVLANYANEHAPFAIKALKAGKHVFSEVLPCQTLSEAVELVETVEKTGLIYAYGENYCYMPATREMKKQYQSGILGEFEYGEGEYLHNCSGVWQSLTYGDKNHWRNNMFSTFYCTHSLGPIIHITKLRPVAVTGFESLKNERNFEIGCKSAVFGIEMVTFNNGGIAKSIHGGTMSDSVFYSIFGSIASMESARYASSLGRTKTCYYDSSIYVEDIQNKEPNLTLNEDPEILKFGHEGSDYYCMWNFVEKIKGNKDADIIDIYEALDMYLPGIFAYRSILKGGVSVNIPNFRNKEEREKYRNDRACTDPKIAGKQFLPTTKQGTPNIPDSVYKKMYDMWRKDVESKDGYTAMAFKVGQIKSEKK